MLKIYLDIETIPDQRPSAYEATLEATKAHFKAPSDLTKEQDRAQHRMGLALSLPPPRCPPHPTCRPPNPQPIQRAPV